MPRANRHFLPDQIWHITHRCHEKAFLLKFVRDRRRYLRWLFEAKKRFGLCVLNYVVTSNHVHLLVKDTEEKAIAQSMQLIAGRTGQEFNQRKARQGAFWEDRYHATAIEGGEHLHRCIVYIDLNMVRAGVVRHPAAWAHGGYREIQSPPERYALIDLDELAKACGFARVAQVQEARRQWVEEALRQDAIKRDERWSEALAVGSQAFVEKMKQELAMKARSRCGRNGRQLHAKASAASLYEQFQARKWRAKPKKHRLLERNYFIDIYLAWSDPKCRRATRCATSSSARCS